MHHAASARVAGAALQDGSWRSDNAIAMDPGSTEFAASERLVLIPLRESVANSIRRWIFLGVLRPGQILTQEEVAQRLGISRMPVREAFQVLAKEGLLLIEAHRRAIVRSLSREELIDHYEVRALIEGEAAALVARNPERNASIVAAHERGIAAARAGDPSAYRDATEAFHRAIWVSADRPRLCSIAEQLWTGLPPHLPEMLAEQLAGSVDEHTRLLGAIQSGSAPTARKLMKQHILNSMQRFLSRYQAEAQDGAPEGGVSLPAAGN
jgi:DNA-binding GntR family transcriptional regulator